jgi:hypothetical protein
MCHELSDGGNPVLPKIKGYDAKQLRDALDRLDQLAGGVMPPLDASAEAKDALTDFLMKSRKGGAQ